MTDQTETQAQETDNSFTITKLGELRRTYFGPDELDQANSFVSNIQELEGADELDFKINFDPDDGPDDGFGILVAPISKRSEKKEGNVIVGIVVAQIPDPATIMQAPKGNEFVRSTLVDHCAYKILNAVRPRDDGTEPGTIPTSLNDFISSRKGRGESLAAFNAVAKKYVKALKKMGVKYMTANLLRQVLASEEFAKREFPKVDQDKWEGLLKKMIADVESAGEHDPAILYHWLRNRQETTATTGEDFDSSDFDALLGNDEAA